MTGAHLNGRSLPKAKAPSGGGRKEYIAALQLGSRLFTPGRELGAHFYSVGRSADASHVCGRRILTRRPGPRRAGYSYGCWLPSRLVGLKRPASATQAARLLPDRSRVHYNHGFALQRWGDL